MEISKAMKLIFLLCCVAKIDAVTFTVDQTGVVRKSQTNLLLAATVAESMSSNAFTQALVAKNAFSTKLSTARDKVNNLEMKLLGEADGDAEGKAERISGALEGVGTGLVGMIQGIQGGDWVQGVQGALGIVSSIVALAGPIGMIAASILSMMSSFFGLFGGSETESQESMIKRVVEAAISDFRDKDMKEDIEGVKQVYQSLSSSVQNFRERKANMSASQAEELYNQIFLGLPVFGKLKARIGEKCEKPGKAFEDEKKVTACLNFVKLYSEASILRQLILADMASLLSELSEEKPTQAHLKITGNNILHIIKKEQESDKAILAPFADPLHHKEKRYTIAILYASIEEYKVLNSYMQTLHEKKDGVKKTGDAYLGSIFKDYVLGCNLGMLQGICMRFDTTTEYNKLADIDFSSQIYSVFIPRGRLVKAWQGDNFTGQEIGPFVGPVVHGQVVGERTWKSLKVETTTDSIETHVRFCEKENMHPGKRCDSLDGIGKFYLGTSVRSNSTDKIHGSSMWNNRISSIYVPAGKLVKGLVVEGVRYGPYFGPQLVNKVCSASDSKWNIMEISTTIYYSNTMVVFCDEVSLKGRCYKDSDQDRLVLSTVLEHCNFKNKIKSLKIPGGKQVIGFSKEQLKGKIYGPYIGPITINEVDGESSWQSYTMENTPTTGKKKKKAARKAGIKEVLDKQTPDLGGIERKEDGKLKSRHTKKHKKHDEESKED